MTSSIQEHGKEFALVAEDIVAQHLKHTEFGSHGKLPEVQPSHLRKHIYSMSHNMAGTMKVSSGLPLEAFAAWQESRTSLLFDCNPLLSCQDSPMDFEVHTPEATTNWSLKNMQNMQNILRFVRNGLQCAMVPQLGNLRPHCLQIKWLCLRWLSSGICTTLHSARVAHVALLGLGLRGNGMIGEVMSGVFSIEKARHPTPDI